MDRHQVAYGVRPLHRAPTAASERTEMAFRGVSDLPAFAASLDSLRQTLSGDAWKRCAAEVRSNPAIRALLSQDPLTSWGLTKPRGYPGDAVLMDFIYRHSSALEGAVAVTTATGRGVYEFTSHAPLSKAARARRVIAAKAIADACKENPRARIMSVAAGHLREIDLVDVLPSGPGSRFVAVDSDPESLALVQRCYGKRGVETACLSAARLIRGEGEHGSFDFVYSCGLYDYLDDRRAIALTAGLLRRLKPGGRLLVGNMHPRAPGRGYIEACMDWWLTCRDEEQMTRLARLAVGNHPHVVTSFTDPHQGFVFFDVAVG